ncbi:MAG: B12-binding domain-containing radical SAM protein [Candidatus Hodarchaeota archaeon]
MKILLIQPPWAEVYGEYKRAARVGVLNPPLGLCYLAGALQEKGHLVKIIDGEAEKKDINNIVEEISYDMPDIIGITSTTPLFHQAKELATRIKEQANIPIVLGGPHITVLTDEAMQEGICFDYGVYGEGERTLTELVEKLGSGESIAEVEGILYREDRKIKKTKPRPLEVNLDTLPFPNRGLLKTGKYLWSVPGKGVVPFTSIMTTRGCPFQCIFCSAHAIFGKQVRYRTSENVLDEIEDVVETLGIRHFCSLDDTLTFNKERIKNLCEGIIGRNIDITWEGWTRANTVDEDTLRLMKKAGLVRLSFGIESGNARILKLINKGVSKEQLVEAYKLVKKLGLETRGSAMIGHPYETRKTAMETLNFVRGIKECDQIYLNIATPYPGTRLYEMAYSGEGGIKLLSKDYRKYRRYGNAVVEVNDLRREDLIKLQKKGLLIFYLTPRRIWYNLIRRAGIKAGIRNIVAFLKGILSKTRRE